MDSQVLNRVDPIVNQDAIAAAEADAEQRRAAIQREEDARRIRDQAIVAGYNRAPDRAALDAVITDPNAPQVSPDVPPPPFTTVGLDETALRHYQAMGVEVSPSTRAQIGTLEEERAAHAQAGRDTGGILRADAAERAPSDAQTTETASSSQTAEPNQPNQPDQPSRPNEPNVPAGMSSGADASRERSAATAAGDDYEEMTVKDLRATADQRNVEVKSDAKKADIIKALEKNDAR